jgi:hypothetical protein
MFKLIRCQLTLKGEIETSPVLTGTIHYINVWCKQQGYKFKKSSNIFGGYYVNPISGAWYEAH